jgi:hypothetical protein
MSSNQEIRQELERYHHRLREINQDIDEARHRGADLSELYRARTRVEEKIEALEEQDRREDHHEHHRHHKVLYDSYSILATSLVRRQSDSALRIKQPPDTIPGSAGRSETTSNNPKTIHHGSHQ